MRDFDSNGLTLADDDANAMPMSVVVTRVAEDEADPDQNLSQTELAKLRSSNHRLRVENLALRTRIERLKSNRSLERSLIIGGMVSLWFFFILFVMTKIIASSNWGFSLGDTISFIKLRVERRWTTTIALRNSPGSIKPLPPLAVQLRCERREYKKQAHADGRGKEDLHSVVVSGHHMAERDPNDGCPYNGQSLQPGTSPSEMSGIGRPLRCFRACIARGWAR
jgi:hypothetical protein